jgi:hypothetical protein
MGSAAGRFGAPAPGRRWHAYGSSPDGGALDFTLFDESAATLNGVRPYAIQVVAPTTAGQKPVPLVTRRATDQLPGLAADGVWFFTDGNLRVDPRRRPAAS